MKINASLIDKKNGEVIQNEINVTVCNSFVPSNVFFIDKKHKDETKIQNIISAEMKVPAGWILSLTLIQIIQDGRLETYIIDYTISDEYEIQGDEVFVDWCGKPCVLTEKLDNE
ncbi:MAG: hypothetical protein LBU90_10570 [Bacteroidales bacterium]|jgi:hypothetical protein|nr:hypothetical protein [Bacteroidales bacterium]